MLNIWLFRLSPYYQCYYSMRSLLKPLGYCVKRSDVITLTAKFINVRSKGVNNYLMRRGAYLKELALIYPDLTTEHNDYVLTYINHYVDYCLRGKTKC